MFSLLFGLGLALTSSPTFTLAQASDACQNTEAVQPSDEMRRLNLEQFGVAVMIPANYRAILRNDGSVQIVDPGTYNLIRCEATGGDPLGRGFSDLVIRQVTPETARSLEDTVSRAVSPTGSRSGSMCISPYPLDGQQGYLVQTMTERHAEYWVEPSVGSGITVFETSCDCSGMTDRMVDVLGRTDLLQSPPSATTEGAG